MKKLASLLPVVCLAVLSVSAKADSTLTFDNNPSGTDIGPYTLTLNNNTNLSLFCMNDLDNITTGESWGVNIDNGSVFAGSKKNTVGFEYEEEAYIYSLYNGHNATDVQDALWTIFDPGTSNKDRDTNSIVTAAFDFALGNVGKGTDSILNDATFYIYDGDGTDPREGTPPQNFVGSTPDPSPVPEPSSLVLFGSGLMGLAGAVRRKLARS